MADRNAPASFTFEEWRVEFNELSTDVGDIAGLPSPINSTAVTDVVEAIDALNSAITTTGFNITADTGSAETVVLGNTITFSGTANEIETSVSATDTITIGLPSNVSITNTLGVGGQSTLASASVTDLTSGRVVLAGTSGELEDSGNLTFDGTTLNVTGNVDVTGNITLGGNITVGDADTDSIVINADLTSHVIPNATNTYDLGASGKEWRNLFLSGTLNDENGVSLDFPSISGTISTEGFSIALAVALG